MRQINKYIFSAIVSLGLLRPVVAQNVTLSGDIYEYATYYISSFDLNTGGTNVQIFRYQLTSDEYPVPVRIWFRASLVSPSLGISSPSTIIEIVTDPFDLKAPVILDNRDISSETTTIYDMASPPNSIQIAGQVVDRLDPSQVDAILQSILASGKIADGEYTFEIQIQSVSGQILASDAKTIVVQSPVSISLEYPGGVLADTLDNVVYTTFPIFQWFSQPCAGCNTFIRVAEFDPVVHSSLEDAIDDQRVLPFDQNETWYLIDNINSFQYPFSGAFPLEEGKVYGWQVMMTLPTTSGAEDMASPIFAFKIGTAGTVETTGAVTNPLLVVLQQVLGEDQFNAFFGSGNEFQGYTPTGQIEINGITVDEASVSYLLNQILSNNYQIQSVGVE
jgi:hypothetical protein